MHGKHVCIMLNGHYCARRALLCSDTVTRPVSSQLAAVEGLESVSVQRVAGAYEKRVQGIPYTKASNR